MTEWIIPILCGWALGYGINYLADVLPVAHRLSPTKCPNCGTAMTFWDFLSGRNCTNCRRSRFFRVWCVNLFMIIASVYLWFGPQNRPTYALGIVLLAYFAMVFVIDMEHRLILHPTSIAGAILAFGSGWISHELLPTLIGGLAGFGIMLGLYYLGLLFSRFRTHRLQAKGQAPDDEEALGAGDVILAGVLGLALGWPLIWFGLLLGILFGGLYGLILVLSMYITRKNKGRALMVFMPYGPFFILSAFLIIYLPGLVVKIVPQ